MGQQEGLLPPARQRRELIDGEDYPLSTSPKEEIPLYSFSGWRQEHVQRALDDFEVGVLYQPHQMWLGMQRHSVVSHGVEARVTGVVDADFEWRKPKDCPQDLFDEWVARWGDAFDEDELASTVRNRIGLGVVPAQCSWTVGESAYWLRRCHAFDSGNLMWFPTPSRRYKLATMDGQETIEDDCDPWVLFKERAASYPHLYGAARSLARDWWLGQEAERLEAVYGRRCGNPVWKVTGPVEQRSPTDDRNDFKRLVTMAQKMLGNGVFEALKFPPNWDKGFDLEFVESKGLAHKVFDEIIFRTDTRITLKLMGAVDNTQGGRDGSRGRAQVHEKQTNKYLGADCKLTARTLYRIARKWCALNHFPAAWAPVPYFEVDPPEDQADLADVRSKYASAAQVYVDAAPKLQTMLQAQHPDAKIDMRQLLRDHQIPLIEPGDASPVET